MQQTQIFSVLFLSENDIYESAWLPLLNQQEYQTTCLGSFVDVQHWLLTHTCDLVVVDVLTHHALYWEQLRDLCQEVIAPVLALIPPSYEEQVLHYYQAGIDDCLIKPASPEILLAKIKVWQRRAWIVPVPPPTSVVHIGRFKIHSIKRQVTKDGVEVKLTNLEFRLLFLLASHPGEVLEATTIVQQVWGYAEAEGNKLLKHLIYRLRRKIENDSSSPQYVLTVFGEGYVFHPD